MAHPKIAKSEAERRASEELLALAERYTGEVKRLPAGEARAHQIKAPPFLPPPATAPNGKGKADDGR